MNSEEELDDPSVIHDDGLGNNRRIKQRQRKDLRLNYDSDSSENDEEEGVEGKAEEKVESDDDMFASDKEDEPAKAAPAKKSKYLDIEQFEKDEGIGEFDQEYKHIAQPELDSDEPGEEPDEEIANYYNNIEDLGEVKYTKKEPKIESFDLKEEASEGIFDVDGNYIRQNQDQSIQEDGWMDELKKSDIAKAKQAQENRNKKNNKIVPEYTIEQMLEELITVLEPAETPLEALARLNPKKSKKKKKVQASDDFSKKLVVKITGICTQLLESIDDVYELSREEFMRLYKREAGREYQQTRGVKRSHESEDEEDYGKKEWEFRWLGDTTVNGPFSAYEMNHWKETHFNDDVEVRKVGEDTFVHVKEVVFE